MNTKNKIILFLFFIFLCLSLNANNSNSFSGSGILESTEVIVSSLIPGKITDCLKEEGETINKDDLLVKIDTENLNLQKTQLKAGFDEIEANRISALSVIAQAESNLENLTLKHNRIKELFSKGSATQQQLDDISTQFQIAENQLNIAKSQIPLLDAKKNQLIASIAVIENQINYGLILSPISGTILEKYHESGEIISMGNPLYKIANLNKMWLKIYMAEEDLGLIKLGQQVNVKVDALKDSLKGNISWVSSEAEFTPKNIQTRKSRTELVYAVKITIEESIQQLKIGMPAEVYFEK